MTERPTKASHNRAMHAPEPQARMRVGKLRAALRAIESSLDDGELRQAAHDALEADDEEQTNG